MLTRCHKRATDQAKCIFHRATTRRTQRPTVRRAWLRRQHASSRKPRPNFARNLTRSFFVIGHKRCNSNDTNSTFEQATGELRATLLGNHSDQRGGRTHRQAAPVTSRCTRYVALHPIRTGALPTDRVQHPQSQEQTRKLRDADLGAVPVGGGRAWPGFEATRRAKLAARTARGRAATHGHTEQPGPHKQTTRHPEIRRGDKHRHQHPTTRPRPVSRPRPRRAQSAPLSAAQPSGTAEQAPPIRRSCPRDPRPRRGRPRGGRRGHGTGSRTRSPGPRRGRSGSTAGRHRARRTRRA